MLGFKVKVLRFKGKGLGFRTSGYLGTYGSLGANSGYSN